MSFKPRGQVSSKQVGLEAWLQGQGTAILIVVTLLALILLALIALPLDPWALATQEYWAFIATASTILGGTVGLWFIWVKFIRARGFAAKLDITLTAGKVFLADARENLQWCDVKLENKGTVTIYYQISVIPIFHKDGISKRGAQLVSLVPVSERARPNVDVGATSYEHYVMHIPLIEAQAVTFQVIVTQDDRTEMWWSHLTTSNLKEEAKS